jgi:hypothetical protein
MPLDNAAACRLPERHAVEYHYSILFMARSVEALLNKPARRTDHG